MRSRLIFIFIVAALLVSNAVTLYYLIDSGITYTYAVDAALYPQNNRLKELNYASSSILKGETKQSIVDVLDKFKTEHQDLSITMVVEKDRVIFNVTEYVFQDDKLVEVKAVDQNL